MINDKKFMISNKTNLKYKIIVYFRVSYTNIYNLINAIN